MYLGIDFGTSGCRATVINSQCEVIAEARLSLPQPIHRHGRIEQEPQLWVDGLDALLKQLSEQIDLSQIQRLVIDGTSGTVLLSDPQGQPLTAALMYNDQSSRQALDQIRQHCPHQEHITLSSSSGLAKALQLSHSLQNKQYRVLNQADFISNMLCDNWGISDYHNALKLGYDVINMQWPSWLKAMIPAQSFPRVIAPGESLGQVSPSMAEKYGFSKNLQICAGTTDANAAFIATGSTQPGDAVTSLGTTLVLKILNETPVQQLESGIYSHKLGNYWLAGGASNAGAGILAKYYSMDEIEELSEKMNLSKPTGLDYYPLSSIGERFPINDPDKQPNISPRPESDVLFLQGLLEGLTHIEVAGYKKLLELGATQPTSVQSMGGGAKNPQWRQLRETQLKVPVTPVTHSEASYGAALLAFHGLKDYH